MKCKGDRKWLSASDLQVHIYPAGILVRLKRPYNLSRASVNNKDRSGMSKHTVLTQTQAGPAIILSEVNAAHCAHSVFNTNPSYLYSLI